MEKISKKKSIFEDEELKSKLLKQNILPLSTKYNDELSSSNLAKKTSILKNSPNLTCS